MARKQFDQTHVKLLKDTMTLAEETIDYLLDVLKDNVVITDDINAAAKGCIGILNVAKNSLNE